MKTLIRAGWSVLRLLGAACIGLTLGLAVSIAATPGGIGGTGIEPGGIGGTGISPGGIGGTGIVAIGPIQRFGSIFVNGGEYELPANTRYRVDGEPATEGSLHLGDMVRVRAVQQRGRLESLVVDVDHAVIGRVSHLDRSAGRVVVLGQTLQLQPATLLRAADDQPLSLSRLAVGDVVRVSALDQGGGHWLATRLTRLTASPAKDGSPFLLRGRIEAQASDPRRIRINGVWFSLRIGLARSGLAVGAEVVARGRQQSRTNVIESLRPMTAIDAPIGSRVAMVGYLRPTAQGWASQGLRINAADALMNAQLQAAARSRAAPVFIVGTLTASQTVVAERVIPNVNAMQFALPPLGGARTTDTQTGDVSSVPSLMSNGAKTNIQVPSFAVPALPAVNPPGFIAPPMPAVPAMPAVPQMPTVNVPSVAPPSVSPPQVPTVTPPTVAPPAVNMPSVTPPSLPSGVQMPSMPRP
ncbi:MAG: DUF5666 domain-containing protein [Thiomonas sp.]|uniref:DUF5666 domain-containing protein n=1 Tax=Thiomonas sp. TaxID=2047785 RepID=UPI002A360142|nr:DUF5666 domain-containing protein [Thiomonas sp.]MDY0329625.1 DUF5666 domain-containing protein [Thiomonas sp.]